MIGRLANIGLHVAEIERSLVLYRDLLGMHVRVDTGWMREPPELLAISGTPGAAIRIVNLITPPRGDGADVETSSITLVQMDEIERTERRGGFQDPGTVHLAFETDDLEGDLARIEAAGFRTLAPPAVISGAAPGRAHIVFVVDPDGFSVELVQRLPA